MIKNVFSLHAGTSKSGSGAEIDAAGAEIPRNTAGSCCRRASYLAVAAGVISYLIGFIPALGTSDFDAAFLDHLIIRGVTCALAALVLLAGILINKPEVKLPWIMLLLLVVSFTFRPIMMYFDQGGAWNGWLVFFIILFQCGSNVMAIVSIVWLRQTSRITNTTIEIGIILISYTAVIVPFVIVPGLQAYDIFPIAVSVGVIGPVSFAIVVGLVARLIFIDILRGRAFQFMLAAWLLVILVDVLAHNVVELSGWALGAVAVDIFPLSAFLWAAAALHPTMHEVSKPATEVRDHWSFARSFVVVLAALVPVFAAILHSEAGRDVRLFLAGTSGVILVLLILRARTAVAAYVLSEQKLLNLSRTDPLTQLLNRRGLVYRVAKETRPLGLAYVDIDGFKLLNDVHGHSFGDRLLIEGAKRLDAIGSPRVAVARIGGDEFALLFANEGLRPVDEVRQGIEDAFAEPFRIDGRSIQVTASAGLVAGAPDAGDARQARRSYAEARRELLDLLRRADIAQYYAKSAGGAQTRYYNDIMETERFRQERILEMLKTASGKGGFHLEFQAIVEIGAGRIVGAEALARLESPDLGSVSPSEFIPLAEKHGHITALGSWVFHNVFEIVEKALDKIPEGFRVSVNVSPLQLKSDCFLSSVLAAATDRPEVVRCLRLEVTESAFLDKESLERLSLLKAAGYSIAIDDFGSEYASLQYLSLPDVDVLKLDQSFTRRLTREAQSRIVVRHVIEMASELGMLVLTEGIETEEECAILVGMGCKYGQGFLWDRPAADLDRMFVAADGAAVPERC